MRRSAEEEEIITREPKLKRRGNYFESLPFSGKPRVINYVMADMRELKLSHRTLLINHEK